MSTYAVAVVGRDRPGIAAAVVRALYESRANIEDSRMSILGGHFAMMLVVSMEDGVGADGLNSELEKVRSSMELEHALAQQIDDVGGQARPAPTHVLTVYGADHPGIVAAVCDALAARQVNIDDLATRVVGSEQQPVYTLICELTLPGSLEPAALGADLDGVALEQGVEVSLRELDQAIL
ncbi:MAG: ACT domain-containing protein [Thermoleophilaceae bacterium]|nr:ACT domain-containing protein [Thermoleophilaceae bacterium]